MSYNLKEELQKEDCLSDGHRIARAAAPPSRCERCCALEVC